MGECPPTPQNAVQGPVSVLTCCVVLQATMLVELLCVLVFALRLGHYAKVIPRDKFWRDPKNICIIVILSVGGACLTFLTVCFHSDQLN